MYKIDYSGATVQIFASHHTQAHWSYSLGEVEVVCETVDKYIAAVFCDIDETFQSLVLWSNKLLKKQ